MKAFPTGTRVNPDSYDTGMDLRDYFAAKIMQGLMASQWQVDEPYSVYCYKIADEMMIARKAQKK
jgi:hypothetical protein